MKCIWQKLQIDRHWAVNVDHMLNCDLLILGVIRSNSYSIHFHGKQAKPQYLGQGDKNLSIHVKTRSSISRLYPYFNMYFGGLQAGKFLLNQRLRGQIYDVSLIRPCVGLTCSRDCRPLLLTLFTAPLAAKIFLPELISTPAVLVFFSKAKELQASSCNIPACLHVTLRKGTDLSQAGYRRLLSDKKESAKYWIK